MNPEQDNNLLFDPIVEEIHQARRDYADKFNGSFKLMLDDARRRQEASGRPIWRPKPKATKKPPSGELVITIEEAVAA